MLYYLLIVRFLGVYPLEINCSKRFKSKKRERKRILIFWWCHFWRAKVSLEGADTKLELLVLKLDTLLLYLDNNSGGADSYREADNKCDEKPHG
jgi:hypothetical protein